MLNWIGLVVIAAFVAALSSWGGDRRAAQVAVASTEENNVLVALSLVADSARGDHPLRPVCATGHCLPS